MAMTKEQYEKLMEADRQAMRLAKLTKHADAQAEAMADAQAKARKDKQTGIVRRSTEKVQAGSMWDKERHIQERIKTTVDLSRFQPVKLSAKAKELCNRMQAKADKAKAQAKSKATEYVFTGYRWVDGIQVPMYRLANQPAGYIPNMRQLR